MKGARALWLERHADSREWDKPDNSGGLVEKEESATCGLVRGGVKDVLENWGYCCDTLCLSSWDAMAVTQSSRPDVRACGWKTDRCCE